MPTNTTVTSNDTGKALSGKERAAAFKRRMEEQGLKQANVWVPADKVAQLQILAEMLRTNDRLEIGPLRDTVTGRLVRIG
jgi:hypothetical protein